jgi:hypothetical protein
MFFPLVDEKNNAKLPTSEVHVLLSKQFSTGGHSSGQKTTLVPSFLKYSPIK